jgi:Uma2 family endonuclease
MSAVPLGRPELRPPRLLTVAEYLELGETESGYTELYEGHMIVSPSPKPRHSTASRRLANAIEEALAPGYQVHQDVDVDLRLAAPDEPGFVPRPDLVVVLDEAAQRVDDQGGVLLASDALLVVEIVSPSSRRMDRVVKRDEYATAGIPHYWIVDIAEPVSIMACHLAGEFGYADGGEITDIFTTSAPFPFEVELARLV